jgi:hypothetical protein
VHMPRAHGAAPSEPCSSASTTATGYANPAPAAGNHVSAADELCGSTAVSTQAHWADSTGRRNTFDHGGVQ